MRLFLRAATALSATALVAAGTLASTARPATAATAPPSAATTGRTAALGPYSVTAYETVNIRTQPNTSSRVFDKILAGQTRHDALCWTHGETIQDHGYTNDVWIGFTEGWASAVYLKGDAYAGLPADAHC
ncbi:SH3 domain-containing protein [Streptomyces sp. NPDC001034]|uniref:SH3 domain-containing protein n=1 Tax=Streptomyces sp. NPDC001034 TaxID=3154375 RepID=UPI003334923B